MDKIITELQERKKSANSLTRNSKLFKTIVEAIKERKAEQVVSLDLKKIEESVSDFFILCQGNSHTQVRSIAENVEKRVLEECGEKPYRMQTGDKWTLVDYVNVVVHIFQEEHRKFYNLENLWADAGRVEHND